MLERPPISNEQITTAMEEIYGKKITRVSFLPLGYDQNTAIFRVESRDATGYFLKLRKKAFKPISVELSQFLISVGIKGVIPVLNTLDGSLWGQLGEYTSILYPFIDGRDGYQIKLSCRQWKDLGQTLRLIHTVPIPADLSREIPHENYDSQWRETVRRLMGIVSQNVFQDPTAHKLSIFMESKRADICRMVERTDALAENLQQNPRDYVLCHADAHPGNYHITSQGDIYLVDWDNPTWAPKEHDLMCIGTGMSGDLPGGKEEKLFYQGYGQVEIDWQALIYYRYERIIQDIAEFGKHLLLSTEGGDDREQSYHYFVDSFSPGKVVEIALQTDRDHAT
jgi:spectinomycin phosphotransferase